MQPGRRRGDRARRSRVDRLVALAIFDLRLVAMNVRRQRHGAELLEQLGGITRQVGACAPFALVAARLEREYERRGRILDRPAAEL